MSNKDKNTVRLLDTRLEEPTAKKLMLGALLVLLSVLIHDGDHIRQTTVIG